MFVTLKKKKSFETKTTKLLLNVVKVHLLICGFKYPGKASLVTDGLIDRRAW